MFGRPDITFKEVDTPPERWCSSGHQAVESWSREGPGTPSLPTRFFQMASSQHKSLAGVYCEVCLVLANALARQKKMEK